MFFKEVLLSFANPPSMSKQSAKTVTVWSRLKNKFSSRTKNLYGY